MTNTEQAISTPAIKAGDKFWHGGTAYVAASGAVAITGSVFVVVPVELPNDADAPCLELHRNGHVGRR